jgi:hypothetical protein
VSKPRFKPCDRCSRRARSLLAMAEWNVVVEHGVVIGLLCDRCQTPEESIEADVNHALLDYNVDRLGRLVGRPKASTS